jgi:biopolymer transport protein TolQ
LNTNLSLLSLFTNASGLVQAVMLLLLAISVTSWTLILQRTLFLRQAKRALEIFEQRFQTVSNDLNKLYDYLASRRIVTQGAEQVFRLGFREFVRLYKQNAPPAEVLSGSERAMRVALAREEEQLEKHLPFLATIGSLSVYVGLFGTVWGIMTAFRALGSVQQATLAMVAPGISEALIATALGLFATIPAVFAYNRFSSQAQQLIRNYDNLAEEFCSALHRRLYQGHQDKNETNADFHGDHIV